MIKLVDLKHLPEHQAVALTWQLLEERPIEANISHHAMPSWEQHKAYVRSYPYRCWFAVMNDENQPVGMVLLTERNELGIAILRQHQRKGYARTALKAIMEEYRPEAAIPGRRSAYFLANVNPHNSASIALFLGLGGRLIQNTYEL